MAIRTKADSDDTVIEALDRSFGGKATEVARYKADGTFKGNHAKGSVSQAALGKLGAGLLDTSMFRVYHFTSSGGAHDTLSGAKVGDQVLLVQHADTDQSTNYETTISVAGQIQVNGMGPTPGTAMTLILIAKS